MKLSSFLLILFSIVFCKQVFAAFDARIINSEVKEIYIKPDLDAKLTDEEIVRFVIFATPQDLKELLSKGYDPNKNYNCATMLQYAIQSLLFNQNDTNAKQAIQKIKILIASGADVNKRGCYLSPLSTTLVLPKHLRRRLDDDLKAVDFLSEKKCIIEGETIPCKNLTFLDKLILKKNIRTNYIKQIYNIEVQAIKIIDLLLEHGADIDQKSYGLAPIHYASNVSRGYYNLRILSHLLDRGANPILHDSSGGTPLFLTIFAANYKYIQFIVRDKTEAKPARKKTKTNYNPRTGQALIED